MGMEQLVTEMETACISTPFETLLPSTTCLGRLAVPVVSIEKRINPRAKLARKLRVRPSDGYEENFEEVATSANVSKRGIYFHTELQSYRVALRLFVTYPFTSLGDPMS